MTTGHQPRSVPSGTLVGISLFWLPLSMLTDGFTNIVLPSRLFDLPDTSRAAALGLISFLGLAIGAAIQPIAGSLGDRMRPSVGRHGVLAVGVAVVLIALATFGLAPTLLVVGIAYVLLQGGAAIAQSAQQGYLPDLVPPDRRGFGAGVKGFMDLLGATVGFVVLGALLATGDVTTALLVAGAVTVGFFILTVLLVREPTGRMPSATAPRSARPGGVFVRVVAARFLFLLGIFAVGRFLYLVVADRLGLDGEEAAGTVGSLLAGLALLTAIAALPSGWLADRVGRQRVMVAGALIAAVGIAILAPTGGLPLIVLGGSLMAVGSASFSAANWALTTDLVPSGEAARDMGLANIGTAGAAAAAGLFGPLVDLADQALGAGYTALFVTAAALCCASAVVSLRVPRPASARARDMETGVEAAPVAIVGPTT